MKMNLDMLFQSCMIMGVIMALSSNYWITIWLGLELSMMAFIPLITNKKKINSESCIKYFIIQSMSSSIMMMGVIMMSMNLNDKFTLMVSILIKLGSSPFHTWVISIAEGLTYYSLLTMLTLMKVAPLNLLSYLNLNLNLILIMSLIVGSLSGLNQNSIKKMICYSSIFNMAFIMATMNNNLTWTWYMLMYSLSMLLLTWITKKLNLNFINQVIFFNYEKSAKLTMWIMLMAMGGFPPFMMFFGKLMVMKSMMLESNLMTMTIMILTSLIIMLFYMRITFMSMMMYTTSSKWMTMTKFNCNYLIVLSNLMMPMILFNLKSL